MWHGVLLFLLGLLNGGVISRFANPRMGLSTHLTALMVGSFVLVIGVAWRGLALAGRTEKVTALLVVSGLYMNWAPSPSWRAACCCCAASDAPRR